MGLLKPAKLPAVDIDILRSQDEIMQLSDDWHQLWVKSPRREVFTTYAWAQAYLKSRSGSCDLAAVVCRRRGGRVGAILPLEGIGNEWRLLGSETGDYADMLAEPDISTEEMSAILEAALSFSQSRPKCKFKKLSELSLLRKSLISLREKKVKPGYLLLLPDHVCPAVVKMRGDEFFRLSQKKILTRCDKKMSRKGAVAFGHIEEADLIREKLDRFFEMHQTRCASLGNRKSLFSERATRDFFRNLVDNFPANSVLRFAELTLDGQPIAYHFGFELDRRFMWYVPTFDIRFKEYWPGFVAIRRLFEYAQARNINEFDFTIGDEHYKSLFANCRRQNVSCMLFRRSAEGMAWYGKEIMRIVLNLIRTLRLAKGGAR